MKCIRCGKETDENQVFCKECLQDMQRHPVKPETPIHLPNREDRVPTKRSNFRVAASKWQDQIFRLKYAIVWLVILIILLVMALALCMSIILQITPNWIQDLIDEAAKQSVLFGCIF